MEALLAAADLCLEDGARIEQVDAALKDWGLPFGSFAWRDVTGVNRSSIPRGQEGQRGGGIDAVLISVGRLGISTGQGYYTYSERGKPGVVDAEVVQMIEADRAAKSVEARKMSDGEVRKRCVSAMAGAGAVLLSEGMARRPSDIDMVAVHGLGFARRTGGVMYAADLMGLESVRDSLAEMRKVSDRIPEAVGILKSMLRSDQTFCDLDA